MQLMMDVKNIATMGLPLLVSISAILMYETLAHQKFWGKFTETLNHSRLDVISERLLSISYETSNSVITLEEG